jgi:hypothetical protein
MKRRNGFFIGSGSGDHDLRFIGLERRQRSSGSRRPRIRL